MPVRRLSATCLLVLTVVLSPLVVAAQPAPPDPAPPEPAPAPPSPPQSTAPAGPTETTAPIPAPGASIVVDATSGAVLSARNPGTVLPPASTTKLLTALVVRRRLDLDRPLTVSPSATRVPARRLNMPAGSRWLTRDLLYALLLCSCNDAAVVLAEGAGGGTLGGFAEQSRAEARRLGLSRQAVVQDPSGLDDEFSVGGGNLLSARDLAIVARAFLDDPVLAGMARTPEYRWLGGDGKPHVVRNQNQLFGNYPGALGLKTGYTRRAGATFVGAARRDGRTLISVVMRSDATYAHTRELLDDAFLLAAAGEGTGTRLPALPGAKGTSSPSTTGGAETRVPASTPTEEGAATTSGSRTAPKDPLPLGVAAGAGVGVIVATAIAALGRRKLRAVRRQRSRERGRALAQAGSASR